jgi:hypothetical protein
VAEEKPPPEFMNALGTEYFVLQSTASSTISESGSRSGATPEYASAVRIEPLPEREHLGYADSEVVVLGRRLDG